MQDEEIQYLTEMAKNSNSYDQYTDSMKKRRKMLESTELSSDAFWNQNATLTVGNTPSSSRKVSSKQYRRNDRYDDSLEFSPKVNRRNFPTLTSHYFDEECSNALSSNQAFTNADENEQEREDTSGNAGIDELIQQIIAVKSDNFEKLSQTIPSLRRIFNMTVKGPNVQILGR